MNHILALKGVSAILKHDKYDPLTCLLLSNTWIPNIVSAIFLSGRYDPFIPMLWHRLNTHASPRPLSVKSNNSWNNFSKFDRERRRGYVWLRVLAAREHTSRIQTSQPQHSLIYVWWIYPTEQTLYQRSMNDVCSVGSHWAHEVVATMNQRHWRWFNVVTTSCAQWNVPTQCSMSTRRCCDVIQHRVPSG